MPIIRSRYEGLCKACRKRIGVGDRVLWTPGEKGATCLACAPESALPPFMARRDLGALNGQAAWLRVLSACEDAILDNAAVEMTPELEKAWAQYQKLKALALAGGTEHEGRGALRQALVAAIKLAL